ncbi:RNA-processing protein, HAT helix [Corchorus olitorius]|uniref:RNA-processing protein, HAT helix n=1 Tax=Corchorus olitorius TaxID=93759 RepID=A0A1R3K829_9ROSI|nr:RNA-processing protein, HAT helix [Corchorus olitorius]
MKAVPQPQTPIFHQIHYFTIITTLVGFCFILLQQALSISLVPPPLYPPLSLLIILNAKASAGLSSGADAGDHKHKHGVEEYYKRMVEENPGNPLFLGNYAQFLYQSKGDLEGAEEYYGRAILADPKDGGTLSQYAKLVWDLHHDHERASTYFERAVQASPQDSHVHAAYASFLWETEEDVDEECMVPSDIDSKPPQFHHGALATAS